LIAAYIRICKEPALRLSFEEAYEWHKSSTCRKVDLCCRNGESTFDKDTLSICARNDTAVKPPDEETNCCWVVLLQVDRALLSLLEPPVEGLVEIVGLGCKKLLVDRILLTLWPDEDSDKLRA
jgi:hypothetical protein